MPIIYDEWNGWTSKSQNIPFKSNTKGVGDGEEKLAAEHNTTPLGQNVTYDLFINNERWECKKLDDDNSFRLGVEVSENYQPMQMKLLDIFQAVRDVISLLNEGEIKRKMKNINSMLDETSKRSRTTVYNGLTKSEVSGSNLEKIDVIINEIKKILNEPNPLTEIKMFDPSSGLKSTTSLEIFYKTLKAYGKTEEFLKERLGDNYNITVVKNQFQEMLEDFRNESFQDKLNRFVRDVFRNEILVLVDERMGYKPIRQIEKIKCNRITSGAPRCKYYE